MNSAGHRAHPAARRINLFPFVLKYPLRSLMAPFLLPTASGLANQQTPDPSGIALLKGKRLINLQPRAASQ